MVKVCAVLGIEITCRGVANAKTRGIFNDDPCKHQARKFDHPKDHYQKHWQYKGKLEHALRIFTTRCF